MTKKIVFSCLLAAATLSGCHIYRPYERPASVTVSDSLFRRPIAIDDTASLATLSWKQLFTDPWLQQYIETGLQQNTDLNVARLRVKEAEALLMNARLGYLPTADASAQGTLTSSDGSKAAKAFKLAASADWEIDIFGKQLNAHRGAKSVLEQQQAYEQAVQTQLIATIANSYYSLLMLDKQVDITRRTAATWAEHLRTMKALKRAGTTTELAVAQTEAQKLAVDASLLSLERQVNEMENSLSTLLGQVPQRLERSSIDEQRFPDTLCTGVPLQLLARRPDVRQSEAQLAEAYYATNAARAAFYPSLTLSGSAGWTNGSGMAVTNPATWLLQAVGSLVQPLFQQGRNIANLKVAKAQQEEALLTFRQSLLNAGAEVNDALMRWQTARGRIRLDAQQTQMLRSALRSSELLMQHSSQNYLEVITARRDLLQAELTEATDRFDEIQGVISLYHALGGGY